MDQNVTVSKKQLYINGEWVDGTSGRKIQSIDPATGEVWLEVAEAGPEDMDRAVDAASHAFEHGEWKRLSASQRGAIMRRFAALVEENVELLGRIETKDNGIHIRDTTNYGRSLAQWIYYYAGLADKIEGATIPVRPDLHAYTVREPVGVVGAITPWNAPLLMYAFKLGPALSAGNTVVLKPAEQTPASALELSRLIHEAGFPPGVVNIVPGYGETAGERLVANPKVNKIAFTGEGRTGQMIMKSASDSLKRVTFELGGKAPHIIFDDADLDKAIPMVVNASFLAAGQSCSLGSRVFVHGRIYDKFMERYVERARRVRAGNPFDQSVQIGPQASEEQLSKTMRYIELGKAEGAKLILGGKRPQESTLANGYFVEPTIFTEVDPQMRLAQEEIFGPVASVIRFENEEDLIHKANNVVYGLSAGVWTQDVGRAHRIASALKAGTVWVNTYRMLHYMLPYGGYKMSGIGRENGQEAINHYTEIKTVVVDLSTQVIDPWS
jgi:(Z)-2-((N-methylformamido)methylene)-5-hydroxybutyrolactone dehydrogenase